MKKEAAEQTIARLREEKRILLAAILKVEDWAFGEGYFITPTMNACFRLIRKLADNPDDSAQHPPLMSWMEMHASQKPSAKRAYNMRPEVREAKRQKMQEYWRKRKEERALNAEASELQLEGGK